MTRAATFRAAAVLGAMLLAAVMILTASRAAFTDLASNDGNAWSTGTVALHDAREPNDPVAGDETFGTALFDASNIAPGYTGNNCIDIVYDGSVDATAALTSISVTGDAALYDELTVVVSRHDGAGCGGAVENTVIAAPDDLGSFTIVETAWSASGGVATTKSYDITITLPGSVGNSAQGATASADFEWTATSS